jgi:hypothetical protein
MMFGDEVATQMLKEASSPQYWKSLKDSVRRQQNELATQQFQDIKDNAPGFFGGISEKLGDAGRSASRAIDVGATRGISRFFQRWGDENRQEAAKESGQYYYAENDFSNLTSNERDVFNSNLKTIGSDVPKMKGEGFEYRRYTQALQYLGREDKGTRSWGEAGLDAASTAASWLTPAGLLGFDNDSMQSIIGAGVASGQSNKNIQETIRQAQESKRFESSALKTSGVVLTGKKGLASAEKMGAQLGLSAESFAQYSQSAGQKVAKLAGAGQNIVGSDKYVGTTKIKSAFVEGLPAEARAKFNALTEADQAKILQNVSASGKGGASAKEAAGLAESEAFFNEGRAGWEGAQGDIKTAQIKLDYMLGDTMGMSSDEQKDVTNWMKGTKADVQYATALGLAGDKGNLDANTAKLTELVTKEMGPKAKKSDIKARVTELLQSGGDVGKLSENVKKALTASRDKLGDTKFRASLDVSNQVLFEGQKASAIGAMKDILGDITSGGKINAEAITDEKLANLKETGNTELAKALGAYRDASNTTGMSGLNEKAMSAQQQKIMALIGQGGDKGGTYESLTAATGDQAQQLAASAQALDGVSSSMAEAFKYFTPVATKNFADGARALAEHFNVATPDPNADAT